MSTSHLIGSTKADLDTPALLVDLDAMEANTARIAQTCRAHGVSWRPHTKGHKTPEIALKQMAAGAIGVTCAKLGEAEVMAAAGIGDILIANQIVGAIKVARLVALRRRADVIVAVDNIANVEELDAAAQQAGVRFRVVIEVDVGMGRAGLPPGPAVIALAREIAGREGLTLAGLMSWESHAAAITDRIEKEHTVADALRRLAAVAEECRQAGLPIDIVSCGGTGTYPYCIAQPGITEVQVGGAIFTDMYYREKFQVDLPFALTMLTTVSSRPTLARIVVDAGKKAMSGDVATPAPLGLPPVKSVRLSAEHTTIELQEPAATPRIGDKLEFIVGYSDTTVHLHEEIVGLRNGRVEAVWSVAGRGKLK